MSLEVTPEQERLAQALHDSYIFGMNSADFDMERVEFHDMEFEKKLIMYGMAQRLMDEHNIQLPEENDD